MEWLRAVVDRLGIGPGDRVLEIGKMIQAAARRNAGFVDAGRAEFLVRHLEDLDLGDRRFDKVFAVRVGLFHREPERAHALVEPWLAPGAIVRAFSDPPARR